MDKIFEGFRRRTFKRTKYDKHRKDVFLRDVKRDNVLRF